MLVVVVVAGGYRPGPCLHPFNHPSLGKRHASLELPSHYSMTQPLQTLAHECQVECIEWPVLDGIRQELLLALFLVKTTATQTSSTIKVEDTYCGRATVICAGHLRITMS